MFRRPHPRFLAAWLFVAALLLKAGMPLLASASAQQQGKAVVEVCTVYGIARIASPADAPAPHDPQARAHHDGHCALQAVAVLAAGAAPALAPVQVAFRAAPAGLRAEAHGAPDRSARWLALRHHGPPSIS